jgi:FKBP-type peptidyl-prolyl cis-trans isomerase FkpA
LLKNVKPLVLKDKRITLPVENSMYRYQRAVENISGFYSEIKGKQDREKLKMYRLLLTVLVAVGFLSACSKANSSADIVAAQLVKDDQLISKYLTANNIKASVIDSAGVSTGIYYTVDSAGVANTLYTNSTTVTVSYTGWLMQTDGTRGPSIGTSEIPGQSTQFNPAFVLGSVIRGWQLGIPEVGIGGAVTLFLPSKYGYGPFDQPNIGVPANSVLIFHIIVYNVTN